MGVNVGGWKGRSGFDGLDMELRQKFELLLAINNNLGDI